MKGGLWTVPIIACGVFAFVIALIKTIQLTRLPKFVRFTPAVLNNVLTSNESKSAINVRGMQKILLDITCNEKSTRNRDDQLFIELQDNKLWLDRWIGGIAVTAAISPLLGLLGTVSGMIETFKMMTLFGSGDPAVVSGGIAQALVTTELGLVVAIPALILNAVLSRRAKAYYNDLESFAILLSKAHEGSGINAKDTELISEVAPSNTNQKALESIPPKEAIA
jgi:biopolymer transport protein ExbB